MTRKAIAALEEKTIRTLSKRRKTDGSGDSMDTHLKKAKKTLLSGNTPTNSPGSAGEDEPADKNMSQHPDVPTEEEESVLYEDDGDKTETSSDVSQVDNQGDETAEDDLSMCNNLDMNITLIKYKTERLMKDWNSPVYAFFDPTPQIIEIDGRCAHDFKCQAKRCKTKVRRYLDKGDARSTGNMWKHVRSCWGDEVLKAAGQAKNANEAREKIVGSFLRNGSITTSFKCSGKGKITYSHRQHTWTETRYEYTSSKSCDSEKTLPSGPKLCAGCLRACVHSILSMTVHFGH